MVSIVVAGGAVLGMVGVDDSAAVVGAGVVVVSSTGAVSAAGSGVVALVVMVSSLVVVISVTIGALVGLLVLTGLGLVFLRAAAACASIS